MAESSSSSSAPSQDTTERPPSPAPELISFTVKAANDSKYGLSLPPTATITELKEKLAEMSEVPAERLRLIYSGRVMKNDETLGFYKVKSGHTVHMVKGAASNANNSSTGSTASGSSSGVPRNLAAGSGNNPLAGLTGARYAGHVQLPSVDAFGPDGGMGMTPDPETMAQTMNSLAFQSQMNEMLQNPQLIDYIISTNPMLQSLGPQARQLMQSDMFRQIMTNPDVLRQMSRSIGRQMTGASLSPFPEPGVTDTTPGQSSEQQQHDGDQSQALPVNPFLSVLNPYLAAAGMGTPPTYPSGNVDPNSQVPNPATLQNLLRSFANNPPATGPTSSALGQAPHTDNPVLPGQPPQPDQTHNGQPPNLFQPSQMGHPPNPFMAAMMQSMAGRAAGPGTSPGAGMPPTNATMGANPFAGLFRGMPQVPMQAAPSPDTRPPEVMYAEQLGQLNDMGFYDFENNVRALVRSGGSVQGAVHQLLQSNENSR